VEKKIDKIKKRRLKSVFPCTKWILGESEHEFGETGSDIWLPR